VQESEGAWEITTAPTDLHKVASALETGNIPYESAELQRIPNTTVKLEADDARKVLKLMEMIEDLDDVQRVSANFDIPDEILQEG
jgi:transcriptional/translational regulatory protein YebC/TACO1